MTSPGDTTEQEIRQIVTRRGDDLVDPNALDPHGYVIRQSTELRRVRLYLVDGRQGRTALTARAQFFRTYEPLLTKKFGESRITLGTAKLRVSGKIRPVPYLAVSFS